MAGQACRSRRAVSVMACEACRATWGKTQRSVGTPASRRALGRAEQDGGRLVDRPLAGVPPVVGIGQRPVRGVRTGDVLGGAGSGEGGEVVALRHGVEASPESGDVGCVRGSLLVLVGRQGIFDEGVLLDHRPQGAGGRFDRCHEIGRAGQRDVGWVAWIVIDLDTTEAGEGPSFTADDQYDVGLSGGDGVEGIVDDLLLRDADLAEVGAGVVGTDA